MAERGFTLIEVLVASVILALALTSAYAALSGGLRWEARAGETATAVLLARSSLAEAGVAEPLAEGVRETALDDGRTLRLTVRPAAPVPLTSDRPRLLAWEVTAEVTGPGAPPVRLTTLKLAPP